MTPSIAVVGAGPGGLTAAIALRMLGLEVEVYEQAPDFKRVGGGIMVHSNGLRVLEALGQLEGFEDEVRFGQTFDLTDERARVISTFDYRKLDVPENRAGVVLRYTLQEHLLEGARLAGVTVHFGERCVAGRNEAGGVRLTFESGREVRCDAAIAFDGLNSALRDSLALPVKRVPIREAYLRGVVDRDLGGEPLREMWGPRGRRFGVCPLPRDKVYFFCNAPLGRWDEVRRGDLDRWIASWSDFEPTVLEILSAVEDWERVNYSELMEVRLGRWYDGAIFVAGDAAHAMTPNLGQGANSAMVDALVLAHLIARMAERGEPLSSVGPRYEAIRKDFVTKIQSAARQMGQIAAFGGPIPRVLRNSLIAVFERFDALSRPSLLLGAGYNPAEQEFFGRIATDAA